MEKRIPQNRYLDVSEYIIKEYSPINKALTADFRLTEKVSFITEWFAGCPSGCLLTTKLHFLSYLFRITTNTIRLLKLPRLTTIQLLSN